MIRKPTVFILGAGASKPYGYPLGNELKRKICATLSLEVTDDFKTLVKCGLAVRVLKEFRDALLSSGKSSVDAFLEHRKEYMHVGKIAIAQSLIPCEHHYALFEAKENWYEYLYSRLTDETKDMGDFANNEISFITFNYDRSLEHFLFSALKRSYGKSETECASILNKIPIIHFYGCLNPLDWQASGGRPYFPETTPDIIKKAASGIRIISEDMSKEKEFQEAQKLLLNSKEIYFLGFGYNLINIKRLDIPDSKKRGVNPIYGTVLGMGEAEVDSVTRRLTDKGVLRFERLSAYDLLRMFMIY